MVHIYEFDSHQQNNEVKQFNKLLKDDDKKIMYVVHRPGCPACDAFIPKWDQFKTNMSNKGINNDIVLAKINVSILAAVDLKDKHNINGVPHIMLQNGNVLNEYTGNRDPEDLEKWLLETFYKKIGGKKHKGKSKRKLKKSQTKKKWSLKYKRSIKCNKPKGFSQKQYCKRKLKNKSKKQTTR